ncbi:hypothetical protein L1O03_03415 [Corynebacterium uropygiale]|uniref:Uncharacterized protein n=1 Tax=Corynebacterium uropygiale TaxID=1775911 RepID=A0A9X1QP41_9CORY|nr:hypothetical protein [Corynebacterium uropygiale]MCF4006226.1 hypothetical protein [Corynebacterium uropygiale]
MKITMTLDLENLSFADLSEFSQAAARNGVRPETEIHYDPEARVLTLSFDSAETTVGDIPPESADNADSPGAAAGAGEKQIPRDVGEQVVNGVIEFLTGRRRPPEGGYGSFLS